MHNGFVTIKGEKMSKSLGNSFFVKDALHVYDGEVLRFYLLATHYRADFNFNEEDLRASKRRLDKLYRLKKRLLGTENAHADAAFKEKVLEALSDDLNISKTLAVIDEMILQGNEALDKTPKDKGLKQRLLSNLAWIEEVLGIGLHDPVAYFQLGGLAMVIGGDHYASHGAMAHPEIPRGEQGHGGSPAQPLTRHLRNTEFFFLFQHNS